MPNSSHDRRSLAIVVAQSENQVIGRAGGLPWKLSADLKHFKRLTMGHHLIMGRKTYESIGRLLPGRTTVIVTRQAGYTVEGAKTAASLEAARAACGHDDSPFVVGGGELYQAALPLAERLYVTQVHARIEGDTFFPAINDQQWRLVDDEWHRAGSRDEYDFSFRCYHRVQGEIA